MTTRPSPERTLAKTSSQRSWMRIIQWWGPSGRTSASDPDPATESSRRSPDELELTLNSDPSTVTSVDRSGTLIGRVTRPSEPPAPSWTFRQREPEGPLGLASLTGLPLPPPPAPHRG